MTESGDRQEVLDRMRASRGFLLPHHGLLALMGPELAAAYDALYARLNGERNLDAHTREFLWLVILASVGSGTAAHHVQRFREAGGTAAEMALAIQVSGLPGIAGASAFAEQRWSAAMPDFAREAAYRRAMPAAEEGMVGVWTIELAGALANACRKNGWGTGVHIRGAYAAGVPEALLAEALSLIIFPAGLPCFVQAAWVWRDLIAAGQVAASALYRDWAAAAASQSGAAGAAIPAGGAA